MEVGLSILLQLVDNGVINNLEFTFFCLYLPLNFKPYFVMLSDVMCGKASKSFAFGSDPVVSVVISNYPLSNGGYLVSFGKDESDGSFKNFDPSQSMFFEDSILSDILESSSSLLPKGCFYLPELALADFIHYVSTGASSFEMKLLPASSQMQGLLLVKVNEASLFKYEQKEEE